MANIRAMWVGWEELHAHEAHAAGTGAPRRYGLQRLGRVERSATSLSQGDE
jgi:hypothetical protein